MLIESSCIWDQYLKTEILRHFRRAALKTEAHKATVHKHGSSRCIHTKGVRTSW